MSRKQFCSVLAIGVYLLLCAWPASSQAQETFFKGKTIRMIVGLAPGGGI